MRLRILLVAFGIVALAALALDRGQPRRRVTPAVGPPAPRPRGEATGLTPRAVDPGSIRDLFRFADASPRGAAARARAPAGEEDAAPSAPSGPRLVGLVRRSGRLVAALAADGEVVLAAPGETAAGVTVLAVDDEGVRIRRADGSEETLVLP